MRLPRVPPPPGDPRHGCNGYSNYGCRCDLCKRAWALYKQDYRYRNRYVRGKASGRRFEW